MRLFETHFEKLKFRDKALTYNDFDESLIANYIKPRTDDLFHTSQTDKPKAEAAIHAIYKEEGLEPPLIIWTQSPLGNIFAKAAVDYLSNKNLRVACGFDLEKASSYRDALNNEIRALAWQSVCSAGWKIGGMGTGERAWESLRLYEGREDIYWGDIPKAVTFREESGLVNMLEDGPWFTLAKTIEERTNNDWLVMLLLRYNYSKTHPQPLPYSFLKRRASWWFFEAKFMFRHQKNLNALSALVGDIPKSRTARPVGLRHNIKALRNSAGWVMPYENICFVSERAVNLKLDEAERLHCETGPAMSYRDGFGIYAWHGTIYDEAWAKTKPTAQRALTHPSTELRRVACEMLGWDKILSTLNAVTIDKDIDPEIGELVKVVIPDNGDGYFLRVRCGTGRTFALPVPPEMKTARQANAWTWGLEPDQYRPEVRT